MKYFQLFCEKPSEDFMNKILMCYDIQNLNDSKEFSKGDLIEHNTSDKIIDLIPDLILYYLPCKGIVYLNEIDEKRCITILSQFIKMFDCKLGRKEKIINKKKTIFYFIINKNNKFFHVNNSKCELDFM